MVPTDSGDEEQTAPAYPVAEQAGNYGNEEVEYIQDTVLKGMMSQGGA